MIKNYIALTTAVIVAVSLFAGGFVPIIMDATVTTTTITNDGAGWLRMAYTEDASDYSVNVSLDGDNINIGGQSGEASDMILYADSDNSVVLVDGSVYLINSSGPSELPDTFTIERASGVVSINGVQTSESVTYAYVPTSGGAYGYFDADATPLRSSGTPLAVMGTYAGVTLTEKYTEYGLVMSADVTSDYINSVRWALPGAEDLSEASIMPVVLPGNIIPIDPIDLDQSGGDEVGLMSVPPTPSYTDGDWGYDLNGTKATIVSYSGISGANVDITIPSTIGGYSVTQVGNSSIAIFDTSLTFGSLVISSGITKINNYAFKDCSGFTGTLTIPSSVTNIGSGAFSGCSGFTGTLTIPSSVVTLGASSFINCSGFTGLELNSNATSLPLSIFQGCSGFTGTLTIPSSVRTLGSSVFQDTSFTGTLILPSTITSISGGVFRNCIFDSLVVFSDATPHILTFEGATIKEVLNLSNVEYTTTSFGLNADSVQDYIGASGFIAPVSISESVADNSPASTIIMLAPVIVGAGLVLGVMTAIFIRRF